MDKDWMREQLEAYLGICADVRLATANGMLGWNEEARTLDERATLLLPTVTKILETLDAPPSQPLNGP